MDLSASERTPPPANVKPMLATLAREVPADPGWAFEMKWDGVRALVLVRAGQVQIKSRNDRDVTQGYPELVPLADGLDTTEVLLDGEIVALDDRGRPNFQLLQRRMHVRDAAALRSLTAEVPVAFMIFDVLWLDGFRTTELAYSERRRLLDALDLNAPRWQTPPALDGPGDDALSTSRELGLEGVVAKRLTSKYEAGRRSASWRKIKLELRQEFVIGGWSPGKGARSGRVGALLLGVYDNDGALRYAGKVGTGFSDDELDRLDALLAPLAQVESPFAAPGVPRDAFFVSPRHVADVRFTEWTDAGHIRHPAYLGLRDDKAPSEVVREG